MIEDRLRDYFETQYEAAPAPENRLFQVTGQARRRRYAKRTIFGLAAATVALVLVVGSAWLFQSEPAVAASPFSGTELAVVNESPLILQGQLGPQPETAPDGADLTFTPIEEPTANDLAAIDEVMRIEGYIDPTVVALGRVEVFETNVYAIHQVDPETGRGQSQVVAVGPDYPSFISVSGPFESEQTGWGPSASRDPNGNGHLFLRIPGYATWQYARLDIDGEVFWQRPSDGFIWMPFQAEPDSTITLTAHDPNTGDTLLRTTLNRLPPAPPADD